MTTQIRADDDRPKEVRLGRMVLLSGFVHVGVLGVLYTHGESRHSTPLPAHTYTVSLIAPAVVAPVAEPRPLEPVPPRAEIPPPPPAPPRAEVLPPEPEPPKLEPVKEEPPPKPTVEKPEVKKPKVQIAEKKPSQPAVRPQPEKEEKKPVVEKKPEPPVEEPAAEPPVPKTVEKPEPKKKEETAAPQKPSVEESPTDEQRDRQILAALDKVRSRVKPAAGTAVRGLPFLLYTRQVKQQVRDSWIVAQEKPGVSAVVRFGILPSGDIVAIELARGSGDRVFDESVLRAVKKADPLPPPPEAYRHEFTRQKVEVVFGETRAIR